MSHVSTTAHYNLPIYGGSDIINPLTDVNGTNEALDTAIYEVAQELASGVTDITDVKNKVGDASLDTASQNLSGAVNELKSAIDTQAGDITDVEANVSTLQSQMATTTGNITTLNTTVAGLQTEVSGKASQTAVNTLATKVGTDALITTADDLSGAVNELKNDIDGLDAGDIDYDNTTSGLTATNVQKAIDEIAPKRTPDVHIVSDGTINLRQLLNNVANAIDFTKVTKDTVLFEKRGNLRYILHNLGINLQTNQLIGGFNSADTAGLNTYAYTMSKTLANCYAMYSTVNTSGSVGCADQSTIATANGDYIDVYY